MRRQGITDIAAHLASKGRNGDDSIVHVTRGETIIPPQILDKNPELRQGIENAFRTEQENPEQFVMGSDSMSINPETNLPEFGLGTEFKKFIKKAGPTIGAVVGAVLGGPIGATIGAGIGSKTSNLSDRDIAKNMAVTFAASNVAAGAGMGNASQSASEAARAAGGWNAPFAAAREGAQAFLTGSNWNPAEYGQSGVGGYFQDIGSGIGRSMGLGETQDLVSAGLSRGEATKVAQEMAKSGVDAVTAAQQIGVSDATVLSNLANAGPGFSRSALSSYGQLNPLEKFGVRTTSDLMLGLNDNAGMGGYDQRDFQVPSYLTNSLRSGNQIDAAGVLPTAAGITTLPQLSSSMGVNSSKTDMTMSKNDILLDRLADNVLNSKNVYAEYPTFRAFEGLNEPTGFNMGGFVGANRKMFNTGGHITGPGGPKDDLIDAKLSNNEFVFTEKAVRGAGNGSVDKGAENMYQLMNNFERRV
tara:strand:+ start:1092 stop:2507 length:1416 start_codon:yes stop_codon:yes gene_type:complete